MPLFYRAKEIHGVGSKKTKVERPLTMYLGAHTVLLTMNFESVTITGIRKRRGGAVIHEKDSDINHILIEAKSPSGKAERHQPGHELSYGSLPRVGC